MNRSRELTKNTLIITIGKVSTQFVTFFLLPFYTAMLTTEEYGTVDLITTLVQLLIPIISLMIDQGVFRYLLNCESESKYKETISSAFFVLTVLNMIFLLIYAIGSPYINNRYKIWVLLILIVTAYSNFFLQIARGLKKTNEYALGSFICSSSTIVLNVLCIATMKMGAKGMLVASFLGNAICCIYLFFRLGLYKYISYKNINKALSLEELKYSIPLVPNQLSLWIMNSSNRLIVTFVLGASANGILAVTHKFPSIYSTFFGIFLLAWQETGAVHYFDEDRDAFFSEMLEKVIAIFSTLCMGIIAVLPLIFKYLVNEAYYEAYYNIPIYLVAFLFNVIIGLLGVVYIATKKTLEIAKTTIISAIINVIANIALINVIGLYAASISTFVGYALTMIYRVYDTKKYISIKYNFKQYCLLGISIGCCCCVYYVNNKILSLCFLPLFMIWAFFYNKNIILASINIIKERLRGMDNEK